MRLSFTKEFMQDYLENNLIPKQRARYFEAQRLHNIYVNRFNKTFFLLRWFMQDPESIWNIENSRKDYRRYELKEFLKLLELVKNKGLLNPIILNADEAKELGLL